MTAEEAVDTLQKVERLLSAKLEGVTEGPWELHEEHIVSELGIVVAKTKDVLIASERNNGNFIALSSVAIPALLGSVRAVLRTWHQWERSGHPSDKFDDGYDCSIKNILIHLATELEVLLPKESQIESNKGGR